MARARNIKPGFYKNEDLAECSIWARYIYPGLWMLADRDGRLEDRPKRIKGELLPFDPQDVEPLLRELDERRFILRYEIGGVHYIQILRFKAHQTPHYSEKKSVIPPPLLQENDGDISAQDSGSSKPIKTTAHPENSKKEGGIKRGSQLPDSLNPDSPNPESLVPNPDSPNPSGGSGISVSPTGSQPPRAVALSTLVISLEKARGKVPRINSTNPPVQAWAKAGVTDDELRAAHQSAVAAREAKGDESPINAGFLDVFVAEVVKARGSTESRINGHAFGPAEWWRTADGIKAKGQELGIEGAESANVDWLKCAIAAKLGGDTWPWIDPRNATQQRFIEEYRAELEEQGA